MFPTIKDLTFVLINNKRYIDRGDWLDVRLQVTESGWRLNTGDASYDQDYRGWWGDSSLSRSSNCRDVARDLIEQARDDYAQSQPDEPTLQAPSHDCWGKPTR